MDASVTLEQELAWARMHTVRLRRAIGELPDLKGMRLACSIHLDVKMVPFLEGVVARGAELFVTTCNPGTVRDDVVRHLRSAGIEIEASRDMSQDEFRASVEHALEWGPTHLCEMGAELSTALHQRKDPTSQVRAGLEATGSGITRLDGLTLTYPIFNWDDLPIKEGLHNRHLVGLTTWHAFFERTRLTLHEKRVVVLGYGSVGRGVADMARAYGGTVCVVERDLARALEARYAGWDVRALDDAIAEADVIVTATGGRSVIHAQHFPLLKDGAFLLNVGHCADEIDVIALKAHPHGFVRPFVEAVELGRRTIYLFAGGSMANLTAGYGDSLNAFDVTLSLLVAGVGHIVGAGEQQPAGVHVLPRNVWETCTRSTPNRS